MSVNYYPPRDRMRSLPFSFTGIGAGHLQEEVSRPSGCVEPELHYTVSGCGVLEFGGRREMLPAGTMFYLPLKVPHRYYGASEPWVSDWVTWHTAEPSPLLAFGDEILIFTPPSAFRTAERFEALYRLAVSGSEANRIRACTQLYELILELSLTLETENDRRDEGSRHMQTIIDYIERSFGEKLTLADICSACGGISEQYLCRLFRIHTGMRPSEYITNRRVEYARSLLLYTDLSVQRVAEQAGFESASYFHRQWKRAETVTPLAYRKLHRSIPADKNLP